MLDEKRLPTRPFSWALVALLLAAGSLHWFLFIGMPPSFPREAADWPKEFRYYAVLKQAVSEGRVPYFVSVSLQDTRKFLAIPETVLSPQILLLRWLSIDTFLLVHILLLQAAGLAGCVALGRRYQLSVPSLCLLWLLLGFNGHITSHLAIGHSMWGGVFLLPWFFLCVLELVEDPPNRRTPIAIGAVLGVILWQGSFHPFVWCVLFLLLLFLFDGVSRRPVFVSLLWSAAFAAWRLVPAAVVLLGKRSQAFETGYPSVADLMAAFVSIRDAQFPRQGTGAMGGVRWWEFDAYIGWPALLWLLTFGIVFLALDRGPRRRLSLPLAITALLSYDGLYRLIHFARLPLLSAERVSSRLLILPVGMLVVLAAIEGERWCRKAPRGRGVLLIVVAMATAVSLAVHSRAWSVPSVTRLLPPPPHTRDLTIEIVDASGERDGLYLGSVYASAVVSLAAAAAGVARWRKESVAGGPCDRLEAPF